MELELRYQQQRETLVSAWTGLIPEPQGEHTARLRRLDSELNAARQQLLGESAEEFGLRQSWAAHWAQGSYGFEPTPDEWRSVARLKLEQNKAGQEPTGLAQRLAERYGLALPQTDAPVLPPMVPPPANAATRDFEAEIRDVLGPERYAAYLRGLDPEYQVIHRVTRRLGLEQPLAVQAWEIQRAARAASEQLHARSDLDEPSRQAALREVRTEAERSLRVTLGERAFASYQEYAGGWLDQLAPVE